MRPLSSSSKRLRPASSKSPSPNRLRGGLVEDLDGQQLLQEALARAAPRLLVEDLSISNLDLRLDIHLLHGPAQLPFAVDTSRQACISSPMHGQTCKWWLQAGTMRSNRLTPKTHLSCLDPPHPAVMLMQPLATCWQILRYPNANLSEQDRLCSSL